MKRIAAVLFAAMAVVGLAAPSLAGEPQVALDTGNTAFVLVSSALVLFMTVGLAFFYGGLVRRKNMLSVLMQCLFLMGVMSVWWVLIGYTLSFGPDVGGVIGGLKYIGLRGIGMNDMYATGIPVYVFMIFQCMFAVITPGLIIGAFAERMKFSAFAVFTLLWATVVYAPVCHWVWGGGFLGAGHVAALDFAGGTVVHINAGIAALVCCLLLGKRVGYPERGVPPHNLPFNLLGAGILWFGWFGFNAGSALAANGQAAVAFVVTNTAAAAAAITWPLIEWARGEKPSMLGASTGAVAGLVAITPAAGFVGPVSAILIGIGSSVFGYIFVAVIKPKLGYDDSLDVFGVHGIGGIWGALATGLFAHKAIGGVSGLFFGNPAQFGKQAIGVGVTIAYSLICTFILLKLTDAVFGLRVSKKEEQIGLDLTQHREIAYTVLD